MIVEHDAHGSYQITLSTGVDVVYHGDLEHPAFDVTIRDETTRIVYGDAKPVPIPYRTVVELRTAIATDPVMFAHEAIIHVARHRLPA